MGRQFPAPPQPLEQSYDRLCPHTPAEFYAQGPLFHGPMFQLIQTFHGMSDTHIGADLVANGPEAHVRMPGAAMVFEPLLLDALQQVVGYRGWLDGWFLMPIGMKRITRFGPAPKPGSRVRASVHYRRLDGRRVDADYEAYDSDGRLWIRVEGLQAWRVLSPKGLLEANHKPREGYLSRSWPLDALGVSCYRVKVENLGDVAHDWIARLYLRPDEWAVYQERRPLDWLLGRVAAKDAVRGWLREHRGILLHPLEVEIMNEADGAPRSLKTPVMPSLAISIAHIENEAVAIAAEGSGLGVDLAEVKERNAGFAGFAFRQDELALFPSATRNAWIHRGWCAKEAAVKAIRLGLRTASAIVPRIVAVDTGTGVMEMQFEGKRISAATWHEENHTIGVVLP